MRTIIDNPLLRFKSFKSLMSKEALFGVNVADPLPFIS